jgi:hypothetical protein
VNGSSLLTLETMKNPIRPTWAAQSWLSVVHFAEWPMKPTLKTKLLLLLSPGAFTIAAGSGGSNLVQVITVSLETVRVVTGLPATTRSNFAPAQKPPRTPKAGRLTRARGWAITARCRRSEAHWWSGSR